MSRAKREYPYYATACQRDHLIGTSVTGVTCTTSCGRF